MRGPESSGGEDPFPTLGDGGGVEGRVPDQGMVRAALGYKKINLVMEIAKLNRS